MFIVDTNVLSELRRPSRCHPKVAAWANTTPVARIFISALTILEIEFGTLQLERKDKAQAKVLRRWIDTEILPRFNGRILPVDTAVAQCCAGLHLPKRRAEIDTLIAATAVVHAMTVVTRNDADFKITGVKVFNPWV